MSVQLCFCVDVVPEWQQSGAVPSAVTRLLPWLPPGGVCGNHEALYFRRPRQGVSSAFRRERYRWVFLKTAKINTSLTDCATTNPIFFSFSEVIISLAVAGCLLFLLVAILLGVICWQKEPMSNQGYRHVINQEVGDESWQKHKLLPRRSKDLMSWDSSDDDELWMSRMAFFWRSVQDPQ